MNSRVTPMTCAMCGATMNAHAEKPVVPISAEEAGSANAVIGLIEEVHQCPHCGAVQSRRV